MTRQEHGHVSRLASILFLGFLLPHSTGNEFFLLQNLSSSTSFQKQTAGAQTSEAASSNENIQDYVLNMPLEERLESAQHKFTANEFGEFNSVVHEQVDSVFYSFLTRALGPFLSGRPAHTQDVDLIHVLAMAIHPHPSDQPISQTADELEEQESSEWSAAKLLMTNPIPHNFQVNYNHRLLLVRIVSDCLILPEYNKIKSLHDAPLYEGALPHLRASLYAFGMAALNPFDAHWAQCGLVSCAVQSGLDYVVKEEWGRLLHRLVDDQTNYHCPCSLRQCRKRTFSLMTLDRTSFCPHRAMGELLERFLSRFNESRNYSDAKFLQHALASLTDAIEWQVDCWTKDEADDEKGEDTDDPPCMMSSLLFAAKQLFYFLLPIVNADDNSGEESEESHRRDMLVSCGIQLLHHPSPLIASEASMLLFLAICYGPSDTVNDYAGAIFESTKLAVTHYLKDASMMDSTPKPNKRDLPIDQLISTVANKSKSYADSMLSLLTSTEEIKPERATDKNQTGSEFVCRLIGSISRASPGSGEKHLEQLINIIENNGLSEQCVVQLVVAVLSSRRSQIFVTQNGAIDKCLGHFSMGEIKQPWARFLLARQAMVAGSFDFAKTLYWQLESNSSSETSFIWLSLLGKVADAEWSLAVNAAKGIPSATMLLGSAKQLLASLSSMSKAASTSFEFQMKVLDLRLDFLDIVTVIRQLTREMRLTGVGPKKQTRPNLHLRNAVKCLDVLATKYLSVYRQHGLFTCQQSRTALRTLHALCRFVASATRNTFLDEIPPASIEEIHINAVKALTLPKGDAHHPLTILMGRLDSSVIQHLDTSVEGKIRAAALLEIFEGFLKCPAPFPRAFMRTASVEPGSLILSVDQDTVDLVDEDSEFENEIEIARGDSFTYFASGDLPASLLESATIPFSVAIIWQQLSFSGSRGYAGEDAANPDENHDESKKLDESKRTEPPVPSNPAPSAASLSSTGAFFAEVSCGPLHAEGTYILTARLGCRDVRGGEWELPLLEGVHSIRIRVK